MRHAGFAVCVGLLLAAGCTSNPLSPGTSALGTLNVDVRWWDSSHVVHFRNATLRPGTSAILEDDPHQISVLLTPSSCDSLVFTTDMLSRHDHDGDTVVSWIVIVRCPAGRITEDPMSLDGLDLDMEIGMNYQEPPTVRLRTRVRCKAIRRTGRPVLELAFASGNSTFDILGSGLFRFRLFDGQAGQISDRRG